MGVAARALSVLAAATFAAAFPGDATVLRRASDTSAPEAVAMRDLRVGDRVLADGGDYEPIYFFGHAESTAVRAYVRFHLRKHNRTVRVAEDHFFPCGKERNHRYADVVKIGDRATAWDGVELRADVVDDKVYEERAGFFEPYTPSGTIVVDGVFVSCHAAPRTWWWLDLVWPSDPSSIKFLPRFYQLLALGPRIAIRLVGVAPLASVFGQEL